MAPPERALKPQRRQQDAGGAHPVSRKLDTTHHPATSTRRPQTRYTHCPATPSPLFHAQTQRTGDRCTTSQTQLPGHTRHVLALRTGSPRHSVAPAAPHLPKHYLTPTAATTADQQASLFPLVSHGTPRPPGTRSLDPNTHSDMDVHQRGGRPRKRGHRLRLLQPTGHRTSGSTHTPPTAQMPHPPRRKKRTRNGDRPSRARSSTTIRDTSST